MEEVSSLAEKIEGILADREFIGHDWFQWLNDHHLLCRLRVKNNLKVTDRNGNETTTGRLFRSVKFNQTVIWNSKKKVSGVSLYIGAHRSLKGLLIVVATQKPDSMISDYYKRWGIETLFGCLKSRGFDLESTHMTDPKKMDKLMGILALAFCWCLIAGHWEHGEASEFPLKKHGRPEKSLFRLGIDIIRRVLKNYCAKSNHDNFLRLLNVLSRT